jgi:hypothetical protein
VVVPETEQAPGLAVSRQLSAKDASRTIGLADDGQGREGNLHNGMHCGRVGGCAVWLLSEVSGASRRRRADTHSWDIKSRCFARSEGGLSGWEGGERCLQRVEETANTRCIKRSKWMRDRKGRLSAKAKVGGG